MKRISLDEVLKSCSEGTYEEQYRYILRSLDAGKIKPVKASGTNGKSPALYREYWLTEEKKDYKELREELEYRLVPLISVDYYLAHLETYYSHTRDVPETIIDSAELARVEERVSKKKAAMLFESGYLYTLKAGTLESLLEIHKYLFEEIYDFAGKVREVNISKGNFRFAPAMYLHAALDSIEIRCQYFNG